MGTIGSVSKISYFENDYVLITNSDILTNLDYENFFSILLKVMRICLSLPLHMTLIFHMLL